MNQRILFHIGFWMSYLLLSSYITADLGNSSYSEFSWSYRLGIAVLEKLGIVLIQLTMFYTLFYFFIAKDFKKLQNVFYLLLSVSVSVTFYRIWIGYVVYPLIHDEAYEGRLFSVSLLAFSFINIYSIVGIAGIIKLMRNRQMQKDYEQKLINEKLESELHFLRSQINPHFFFNTLNNIYGLARKKSENTADVVMKLSKIMRFMLYDCSVERIALEQEIKVLEDYIELEKIRYGDRLQIDFSKDLDNDKQSIAPLLLLPFVENSFKHGASEMRRETIISINITLVRGHFLFRACNNKNESHIFNKDGLGLKNVKRQLELIYPNKFQLDVVDKRDSFEVMLKLDLNA